MMVIKDTENNGWAHIKSRKQDTYCNDFYIFDMFNVGGELISLNRYVLVGNVEKRPFEALTEAEELILNPIVEIEAD